MQNVFVGIKKKINNIFLGNSNKISIDPYLSENFCWANQTFLIQQTFFWVFGAKANRTTKMGAERGKESAEKIHLYQIKEYFNFYFGMIWNRFHFWLLYIILLYLWVFVSRNAKHRIYPLLYIYLCFTSFKLSIPSEHLNYTYKFHNYLLEEQIS